MTVLPFIMLCLLTVVFTACTSPPEVTAVPTPTSTTTIAPMPTNVAPTPTNVAPTAVHPTLDPQANLPQPEFPTATPLPPTATPTPPQLLLDAARQLGRGQILDAVFLPAGDTFAIALGWANGVSLATLDGQELWWQPTDALLVALAADQQGAHIAAILESGALVVYSADTGAIQQTADSPPYVYWSDIAFSPDGRWLAFQSIGPNRGDPIFLLDLENGALSQVPSSRISSGVRPSLVWSPDGQTLTLPALGEDCARLLDVNTGEVQLDLQTAAGCYDPWAIAYASDGQRLALADPSGGVALRRPDDGQLVGHLPGAVLTSPDWAAPPLTFSSDGRWLVTPGGYAFYGDAFLTLVWDVAAARVVAERQAAREKRLALAFAGDTLLSLYADGRITRWPFTEDGATETVIGRIPVIAPYLDLRWSANGARLATPLTYGGVAVWDVGRAEPIALFPAPLTDPALSPNGRWLALRHPEQREIQLYDVDSGATIPSFAAAESLPAGDPFSPDGRWLAYGSGNRLQLVKLDGTATAVSLAGYPEGQTITRVIWSPTGDALVAAGANPYEEVGQIILWEETGNGDFIATYQGESVRAGYTCCVTLAAFSPQGGYVAFEFAPDFEASSLLVEVYDRQQGTAVLRLNEYELLTWLDDDRLLTHEVQYETKFTQWAVGDGRATVSTKSTIGDEVFAPSGGFYAHTTYAGPNIGRAIRVGHWLHRGVTQDDNVGNDMGVISWSPDGRWLAALASDGSLWLWPVDNLLADSP
ncbi:MAG: WD40 repeat domain-containing protein [Chloroflexi bacterium]|nr:WD40 repeat domain-containing protein [Chloroflexota bacterium]